MPRWLDIGMFTDFRSTCRTPAVKLISSTGKATGTLPRMPMYLGKQLLRSDVIMDFKYSLHLSGIKRTTAARTMFNGGHAPNNRFKFGYCTTSHGSGVQNRRATSKNMELRAVTIEVVVMRWQCFTGVCESPTCDKFCPVSVLFLSCFCPVSVKI
jgi:hypothetical protein